VMASGKDCGPTFTPATADVPPEIQVAGVVVSASDNDDASAAEQATDRSTEDLAVPADTED
jgi:hypothetical protein